MDPNTLTKTTLVAPRRRGDKARGPNHFLHSIPLALVSRDWARDITSRIAANTYIILDSEVQKRETFQFSAVDQSGLSPASFSSFTRYNSYKEIWEQFEN